MRRAATGASRLRAARRRCQLGRCRLALLRHCASLLGRPMRLPSCAGPAAACGAGAETRGWQKTEQPRTRARPKQPQTAGVPEGAPERLSRVLGLQEGESPAASEGATARENVRPASIRPSAARGGLANASRLLQARRSEGCFAHLHSLSSRLPRVRRLRKAGGGTEEGRRVTHVCPSQSSRRARAPQPGRRESKGNATAHGTARCAPPCTARSLVMALTEPRGASGFATASHFPLCLPSETKDERGGGLGGAAHVT
ncbi:hypothetical protein FA09DRAFT_59101 [Tilletiopsis washingtonensis]|uniref:Uncharacterized protein n=1 Tax=Tilletiopsis washingtonensis TaxID=58919 RepID=A0A316Z667_9BASI|nr:hypothetical protein FA09DRAFT_59101 [Tilletiopsis washingtonensis]PWN97061.1 hypothetical protein FA09DRAFT_59101 [Tilletiopsis washingtonensis]